MVVKVAINNKVTIFDETAMLWNTTPPRDLDLSVYKIQKKPY